MTDLELYTKNGHRRFNISVHEDRVILDIRRRTAGDEWEPFSELVLSLAQYRQLLHWMFARDMELESHD